VDRVDDRAACSDAISGPPDTPYTDEQMKDVQRFWEGLGVRPQDTR
jgi:hypothetical protein